jgi:hypothetical protein
MRFLTAMLFVALSVTSVYGQYPGFEWNKKSTLATEQQVEFPGTVLEPGVYIVRLRHTIERRSQVEILNREETQLLATVVAVPDHHVRPDDNSDFTYHEVKRSGPRPVRSWYFPGDLVGLEFVYPGARAKEIAKNTEAHVMAFNSNNDGTIVAMTPNGKEIVIEGESTPTLTARQKPQ